MSGPINNHAQKSVSSAISTKAPGVLQTKCACGMHSMVGECRECRKNKNTLLQRFPTGARHSPVIPAIVHEELRSQGQPLQGSIRKRMESRFHYDFSQVKVHTGERADQSAQSVRAQAFTMGSHVVFANGRYAPGSTAGDRLLAHELTHVVQQRGGLTSSNFSEPAQEAVANRIANEVGTGTDRPPHIPASDRVLARAPDESEASFAGLLDEIENDKQGEVPKAAPKQNPNPSGLGRLTDEQKAERVAKARTRLAKTEAWLDRAEGHAKQTGGTADPHAAAIVAKALAFAKWQAEESGDRALLAETGQQIKRFQAVAPAGSSSGVNELPMPASKQAATPAEGHRIVSQLRAQANALNPAREEATREELANLQKRLKTAKGQDKKDLQKKIERAQSSLKSAEGRRAISAPTIIDDAPQKLQNELADVNKRLAGKLTPSAERTLHARSVALQEQIAALTNNDPNAKVPLSALKGGRLGHSSQTFVLIQIVGPPPKNEVLHSFTAQNDSSRDLHAEDVVLKELKALPNKAQLKGATMRITGDQEVCDRCAPRAREFAIDHGLERVVGITAHVPARTGSGGLTGNAASAKVSQAKMLGDPKAIDKIQKAQQAAGQSGEGEIIYKESTLFRRLPILPKTPGGTPSGGAPAAGHTPATPVNTQAANVPAAPSNSSAGKPPAPKNALPPAASTAPPTPAKPAPSSKPAPAAPVAETKAPASTKVVPPPTPKPVPAKPPIPPQSAHALKVDVSPKPVKTAAPKAAPPVPKPATKSTSVSSTAHVSATPGSSPAPSAPKASASATNMRGGKPIVGADQAGFGGTFGRETTRDHGKGVTSTTSSNFDGKILTSVEEVPHSNPKQYRVSLTVNLGGSVGGGVSKQGSSGGSVGASLSGSASLTQTWSHQVSKEEADKYLGAARTGAGGADQELQIAKMVKDGDLRQARQILEGLKKGTDPLADPSRLHEGDISSTTAQLQGGGGVNAGYGKFGLAVGATRSGELTRTREVLADGKIRYTVSVVAGKGKSFGGSAGVGVAGFGVSEERNEFQSRSVSFILDSKQSNYQAMLKEVAAADTVDDLAKLQDRHKELVGSKSKGEGGSSQGATDATLAGVGLSFGHGDTLTHEAIEDASGITHKYEGAASSGLTVKAFNKNLASVSASDSFRSTVTPDNRATGETNSDRAESDYGLSAAKLADSFNNRPRGTALGVVTGNAKLLQEKKGSAGALLDDDSFTRITEQAKDPAAWTRGFPGRVNTDLQDWQALRHEILAAGPDRNKISIAMANFEHGGSDRSKIVQNVVSDSGYAFDFPDQIADQKDLYKSLVVSDPALAAHQLAEGGDRAGAIEELNRDNKQLGDMLNKINEQAADINPAALGEMTRRIAARRTQLRAELRRLTPAAAPATNAAAPGQSSGAAPQVEDPAIAQKRVQVEERNAHLSDLIHDCLTLKERETAYFNKIDAEFAKDEHWYSSHDFYDVLNWLNEMKKLYPNWELQIKELESIYVERGETADRANQFAPNRARWEALNSKLVHS